MTYYMPVGLINGHLVCYYMMYCAGPRASKPCWLSTLNYRVCSICLSFLCIVYNTKLQQFLIEFHRDRGIEWRGILYPSYSVLLQSPTTHLPCILQRFWHTLSPARIYSSQKKNIVIPEVTSEVNSSHSPLFLGREHGNVQNYKLWKFVEN